MKGYKQLTEIQRYQIWALKKAEMLQKDMAVIIGISASALGRNLRRNKGKRGYRPHQANIKALSRRKNAAKAIKMTAEVCTLIEKKVRLDFSPGQVSGWLLKEQDIEISHERICQPVWTDKRQGGELYRQAPPPQQQVATLQIDGYRYASPFRLRVASAQQPALRLSGTKKSSLR